MIAKISSTENLGGALGYNFKKVQHNEAAVLCVNELRKGFDGTFQMDKVLAQLLETCGLSGEYANYMKK